MKLEETQEKIITLNKMAEVLINLKSDDYESRKLAKYDFVKMNMTESISLKQVNQEIQMLQEELAYNLDEYEEQARRLEAFVKILNTGKDWNLKLARDILLE